MCTAKWVIFSSVFWCLMVPLYTVPSGTSQHVLVEGTYLFQVLFLDFILDFFPPSIIYCSGNNLDTLTCGCVRTWAMQSYWKSYQLLRQCLLGLEVKSWFLDSIRVYRYSSLSISEFHMTLVCTNCFLFFPYKSLIIFPATPF